MPRPIIAITMGDPTGIGPEIVMKCLSRPGLYRRCRPLVIGDAPRLEAAGRLCRTRLDIHPVDGPHAAVFRAGQVDVVDVGRVRSGLPFGKLSPEGGDAAYRYVERAARLAIEGKVHALCTAPLNKEAMQAAGHRFPGHTELLAHLTGVSEVSMMLVTPKLRVVHVTTHVGLIDAIARIDAPLVERTITRTHDVLTRSGLARPRIGVCAINPHAGEHGLFGHGEEEDKILPAIQACQARGWALQGPLPADALFFRAARGDFDAVIAMYHDQGHGPVKVLGIETGVNVTIGLPFIRTSVDHGTAFDIAGTGAADERPLTAALRQAIDLQPDCGGDTR